MRVSFLKVPLSRWSLQTAHWLHPVLAGLLKEMADVKTLHF
jgi:hypothetical protein